MVADSMAGSPTQKGVTSYALSNNRQRPLAGCWNAAIFNTFRRFRAQVFIVAPPFILAYVLMNWAIEKYAMESAQIRQQMLMQVIGTST